MATMVPVEGSTNVFPEEGRERREQLRVELHESACALRIDRIGVQTGRHEVARFTLKDRVRELGFGDEGAQLIDLLPLVHVAWADGAVHASERAAILRVLDHRGVPRGRAYAVMTALLEAKPTDEYLTESLAVLKEFVGDNSDQQKSVVQMCLDVAKSAGGFLGVFKRVSKQEKEMISKIADSLGAAARAEFKARMI